MTGLEILGIAKVATTLLKQGYDAIEWAWKKYKHAAKAGTELFHLYTRFQTLKRLFESWVKRWSFEDRTPEWLLIGCWGKDNWENICLQIRYFQVSIQKFKEKVQDVLGSDSLKALKKTTAREAERQSEQLSKGNHAGLKANTELEDWVKLSERLKYAWEGEEGFSKQLQTLENCYDLLERSSKEFFQYPLPTEWRGDSLERFKVTLDSERPFLGDSTGLPSEELYVACMSYTDGTENGPTNQQQSEDHSESTATGISECSCKVYMELDLPAKNNEYGISASTLALLRYELLLRDPSTDARLDLLFEGPFKSIKETLKEKSYTFKDAVDAIKQTHNRCAIQITKSFFRGKAASPPLASKDSMSIGLQNLFKKENSRPGDRPSAGFWDEDQINLALKVAESGLYLLGTSWLSDLSTHAVFRVIDKGSKLGPRYVLHVNHVTCAALQYKNEKLPNMFRIGIVLAEIALLESLQATGTMPRNSEGPQGVSTIEQSYFIFTNSGPWRGGLKEKVEYPFDRMIDKIKQYMGQEFGEAVDFCLRSQTVGAFSASESLRAAESDSDKMIQAYAKVLADYRQHVYAPISHLASLETKNREKHERNLLR